MTGGDLGDSATGSLNAQSSHPGYAAVSNRQGEDQPARKDQHPNDEPLPERLPDTFAEFMAEGDVRASPTNFFAGLLKKAGTTIESSLHQAQQTGTDALSTAQNAGSSAFSAVTGIVQDIGSGLAEQNSLPSLTGPPSTTKQVKSLRLSSHPLMLLSPTTMICSNSICAVSPNGKIVEHPISPSTSDAQVTPAVCATMLPNSEAIVGLANGGLHVLSATTAVDHLRDCVVEDSHATVLSAGDNVVAVGTQHGNTKILNIADLSLVKTITPPNLCTVQLGAALKYAPVACLAVSKDAFLLVGYDDGAVKFRSIGDDLLQMSFVAHAERVSGALLFYDVLAVTIGNATDPSLAVFDAYTGRCLRRIILPYAPYSLGRSHFSRGQEDGVICPSELSFIVGGAEGQVELFRVVVLSPEKVELHRVKMLSDRSRGKNRAVMQVKYVPEQALLFAVSVSGEMRRWQLSKEDGCNVALLEEELSSKPLFTEENIKNAVDQDFSLPDGSRLNSMSAVIRAQTVLAAILENESVSEHEKDRVATEFQQRQAEMLMATSKEDTELRRARRRIVSRFEAGLRASDTTGSVTDQALAKAAQRTAVFEMEFASRRHLENLDQILMSTIADIKNILQACLKRLPHSASGELVEIKRGVDAVDQEEVDNN